MPQKKITKSIAENSDMLLDVLGDHAAANIQQWDLTATLITPLLGGGTQANLLDEKMPVRPTQIKGGVRQWWRFLESLTGRSWPEVLGEEKRIFGDALGDKTGHASLVRIRVVQPVGPIRSKKFEKASSYFLQGDWFGVDTLAPFLISFQFLTRRGNKPGLNREDIDKVQTAVAWWSTFSGLGAKTGKGYGKLDLHSSVSHENKPINHDLKMDLLGKQFPRNALLAKAISSGALRVSFSAESANTAIAVMKKAATKLKDFRSVSAAHAALGDDSQFKGQKKDARVPNPVLFVPIQEEGSLSWRCLAVLYPSAAENLQQMGWSANTQKAIALFMNEFNGTGGQE